jgi:hypothetical protein
LTFETIVVKRSDAEKMAIIDTAMMKAALRLLEAREADNRSIRMEIWVRKNKNSLLNMEPAPCGAKPKGQPLGPSPVAISREGGVKKSLSGSGTSTSASWRVRKL